MDSPRLSQDGRAALDRIVNAFWPPIMQPGRLEKISRFLSMILAARGLATAGEAEVVEAVRMVVPRSYDPFFHMMEDPERFKRTTLDTNLDMAAYQARPIAVRRWLPPPGPRPAKPAAKMRVTAFVASPRKKGNTALLVEEALRAVRQAGAIAEQIHLHQIDIKYCIGCRRCKDQGFEKLCSIKDDMTDIYAKIVASDALVVGFPVYSSRECAQLATFFDRWDCLARFQFRPTLEPGRRALVIGTWGYPYIDTYDHVIEDVMVYLKMHRIETVEAISACGFEGLLHGLDPKRRGRVAEFPAELHKAFEAGLGLVGG